MRIEVQVGMSETLGFFCGISLLVMSVRSVFVVAGLGNGTGECKRRISMNISHYNLQEPVALPRTGYLLDVS